MRGSLAQEDIQGSPPPGARAQWSPGLGGWGMSRTELGNLH